MVKPKIVIDEKTKKELDKIKLHPRETYGDIIIRLIKYFSMRNILDK